MSKKKSIPNVIINADGMRLEQVKEYKYLGSWVTSTAGSLTEIKRRIEIARSNFWDCKEFLRRNINIGLKLRLLNVYIFSVLSYASETWTYSNTINNKIKSFEMWCYRRILRVSWKDHVTNREILQRV